MTPQTAVEKYLRHLRGVRQLSPNTVDAYRTDLAQLSAFLSEYYGTADWAWCDVARADIRAFVANQHDRGRAKRTIARRLSAVRSFLHFLCGESAIRVNAARHIRGPRIGRTLPNHLSQSQVAEAFERARDGRNPERDTAVLELLYGSGLRLSELHALDVGDVDLAGGYVRVRGKGNKERIVPVGRAAVEALREYLAERGVDGDGR